MAELGGLTQKIAGSAVGAVKGTAGVASSIAMGAFNTVKQGVIKSTGIQQASPKNVLVSTLDQLGLGAVIPALMGSPKNTPNVRQAEAAASTVAASSKPLENLLKQLLTVNEAILDTNKGILASMQEQNQILMSANDLTKKQMLANIEAAREAAQVAPEGANTRESDAAKRQSSGIFGSIFKTLSSIFGVVKNIGGFLGTLLVGLGGIATSLFGWLKGIKGIGSVVASVGGFFGKFLAPLSAVFTAIGGFFGKILAFGGRIGTAIGAALEFLAPVGRVLGSIGGIIGKFAGMILSVGKFFVGLIPGVGQVILALLSLERTDWTKMFENLSKVFGDLAEGNFLDAIIRIAGTIGDVILKSLGRMLQTILEFFGFETAAKAVKDFLDNFNLADFLVESVNKLVDVIKNIGTMVVDAAKMVGQFASDAWDFISSIPSKVGDMFSSAGEMIGGAISNTWNFFKSLPGKFADAVSGFIPDFLKNAFKSLFGGGASSAAATTAAPTSKPIPTAAPTEQTEAPPAGETRPRTRAMPRIGGIPNMEFVGKSKEEIFDVLVQRYSDAAKAEREAERIYKALNTARPTSGSATSSSEGLAGTVSNSAQQLVDQTNVQQLAQSAAQRTPVVINNVPSMAQPQNAMAAPRTSGAASTAPAESHIDRAMYGSGYGAGVP